MIFLQDKRQPGVVALERGLYAQQVGFINFKRFHGRLKYALMAEKSELNSYDMFMGLPALFSLPMTAQGDRYYYYSRN